MLFGGTLNVDLAKAMYEKEQNALVSFLITENGATVTLRPSNTEGCEITVKHRSATTALRMCEVANLRLESLVAEGKTKR